MYSLRSIFNKDLKTVLVGGTGVVIIIISTIQFYLTNHPVPAFLYLLIGLIYGTYLICFRKKLPLFSPVFLLFIVSFNNFIIQALSLLIEENMLITFNSMTVFYDNRLLFTSALLYFIYFLALIIPILFFPNFPLPKFLHPSNLGFLKRPFQSENITIYLIIANCALFLIVFIILHLTGFDYFQALLNPLKFRMEINKGVLSNFVNLILVFVVVNNTLLSKISFTDNVFKLRNGLQLKFFIFLHIFFILFYGLISGSRSIFLGPVMLTIVMYTYYNKVTIKSLFIAGLAFLITLSFISLYGVYRVAAYKYKLSNISWNQIKDVQKRTNTLQEMSDRMNSFKYSLIFFRHIENKHGTIFYYDDFQLINQIKTHILQPVPRNLYPDKGYYLANQLTKDIFPHIFYTNVGLHFGGIAKGLWNMGVFWIIFASILIGLVVMWYQKLFVSLIQYDTFCIVHFFIFTTIPAGLLQDGFINSMGTIILELSLFLLIPLLFFLTNKFKFVY